MITNEQIETMDIKALKLNFSVLMNGIVTAYGDDQDEIDPRNCPGKQSGSVSLPGSENVRRVWSRSFDFKTEREENR